MILLNFTVAWVVNVVDSLVKMEKVNVEVAFDESSHWFLKRTLICKMSPLLNRNKIIITVSSVFVTS